MRKLDKIVLGKANIAQSDILRKKDMQGILGGLSCDFICSMTNGGSGTFECCNLDACYDKFFDICEVGGHISCS